MKSTLLYSATFACLASFALANPLANTNAAKIETGSAAPKTKMVLVDWMLQKAWDEMIADSVSLGNVRLEEPKVFWIIFAVDELSVIKTPTGGEENAEELRVEREILERLGDHPRIVKLYDFERGNLREDGRTASYGDILKWSAQAAEGMQYFHAKGVLQVDIGLHNLLVDWDDNVKYCDFSGSSIDGSRPTVVVSPTAQHPKACSCSSLHFCYIPGHRQ
ncbi:serine/threonine protein kinase [Trichophyton equinum CBS 127.97]|uniref:Serine/threonine protein kinase n=1 Tax=Trichophyton equinum (strain ATCC MYA-4606 / CBS 127.97) TaxID=559882 RepID=F2PS63_TRIEC|nr:serine/threonine protein kinase [Trichophyton equinum CBS 127.97]